MKDKYNEDYLNELIPEMQAAKFLGFSVRSLQGWRVRGGGPKFVRISSRAIRYRRKDLIDWSEGLLISNTSCEGGQING